MKFWNSMESGNSRDLLESGNTGRMPQAEKKFGTGENAVIGQNTYTPTFSRILLFFAFLQSIIFAFFTK